MEGWGRCAAKSNSLHQTQALAGARFVLPGCFWTHGDLPSCFPACNFPFHFSGVEFLTCSWLPSVPLELLEQPRPLRRPLILPRFPKIMPVPISMLPSTTHLQRHAPPLAAQCRCLQPSSARQPVRRTHTCSAAQQETHVSLSRRNLALGTVVLVLAAPSTCQAASRKGGKRTGLSIQELMDITAVDVGRNKSLVTGQVDKSVYDDQLDFGDPSGTLPS